MRARRKSRTAGSPVESADRTRPARSRAAARGLARGAPGEADARDGVSSPAEPARSVEPGEDAQPVRRVRRHQLRILSSPTVRIRSWRSSSNDIVRAQVPGHHLHPDDDVRGRPGFGLEAQQREFRRQPAAVMRRDERVDAGDVRVDLLLRPVRHRRPRRARGAAEADRAQKAILRQRRRHRRSPTAVRVRCAAGIPSATGDPARARSRGRTGRRACWRRRCAEWRRRRGRCRSAPRGRRRSSSRRSAAASAAGRDSRRRRRAAASTQRGRAIVFSDRVARMAE